MQIIKKREVEESWRMNSIMQYQMIKSKNGNICSRIQKICRKKEKDPEEQNFCLKIKGNKKKEEFGVLTTQIEILSKKYQDLYEVMDNTLCP
jgi:hypothetical protein